MQDAAFSFLLRNKSTHFTCNFSVFICPLTLEKLALSPNSQSFQSRNYTYQYWCHLGAMAPKLKRTGMRSKGSNWQGRGQATEAGEGHQVYKHLNHPGWVPSLSTMALCMLFNVSEPEFFFFFISDGGNRNQNSVQFCLSECQKAVVRIW